MDHLKDCIIGVRPEMITAGECFGGCACECHALWDGSLSRWGDENGMKLLGLLNSTWSISPRT